MVQQYELCNGEYSHEEMITFDQDKLKTAEKNLSSKYRFEKERAEADITRLTWDIRERVLLINNKLWKQNIENT